MKQNIEEAKRKVFFYYHNFTPVCANYKFY